MFSLLPKDEEFYLLFEKAAANVSTGAIALNEMLQNFKDATMHAAKVKEIEHKGDEITHDTIQKMNKTFITPLDREDIHELICRLDDILDLMDGAVTKISLYKITEITDDAKQLGTVLIKASAAIERAVKLLRNLKQSDEILRLCVTIHTYENEGDRIEQHALASLFTSEQKAADIIKWKDIYEDLEAASDKCEDVANILEGIVLKNA